MHASNHLYMIDRSILQGLASRGQAGQAFGNAHAHAHAHGRCGETRAAKNSTRKMWGNTRCEE